MRNSIRSVLVALAIIVATVGVTESAHADRGRVDSAKFMRKYCLGVNVKIRGLAKLLASLADLAASIKSLANSTLSVSGGFTPPALCLPGMDFGANVSVPGLDSLAACLGNFTVQVQTPDMSGVASCVSGLLQGGLQINLPNFDPNQMLSCLNAEVNIDYSGLANSLLAIARALANIVSALDTLINRFNAQFDSRFFANIRALATLCRQAGY